MPQFSNAAMAPPVGRRLAYHLSGAQLWHNPGSGWVVYPSGPFLETAGQLNNAQVGGGGGGTTYALWLGLPAQYDLTHIYLAYSLQSAADFVGLRFEVSSDSLTPTTGVWTTVTTPPNGVYDADSARNHPVDFNHNAVRALRLTFTRSAGASALLALFHLYGLPSSSVGHRLTWCDRDGNPLDGDMDYGNLRRGETATWRKPRLYGQPSELYLVNGSATLTANDTTVGFTDESTSFVLQDELGLSLDGMTYTPTLDIASVAPGDTVGPIYIRWSPLYRSNPNFPGAQFTVLQADTDTWS